ncbi:MAG: hypothetical protein M5U34_13460 [Chloroflexi bacterium]|nr:hypothetical protein [Chloroflexota bacterium]
MMWRPTILEAAGLPGTHLRQRRTAVAPWEGTSMLYSFNEEAAPEQHDIQYFEMFGNRGIITKGGAP